MRYIPFDPANIQGFINYVALEKVKLMLSMFKFETRESDQETANSFLRWFNRFKEINLDHLTDLPQLKDLKDQTENKTLMIIYKNMGFTVEFRNNELFFIKFDGDRFVGAQSSNVEGLLDESMQFLEHINPSLKEYFPYLDVFSTVFHTEISSTDVQEGELVNEEGELHDYNLQPVDRIGNVELSSNPFLRYLPYKNIAIARTTKDGERVFTRIKGYNKKPVEEYVRPTLDNNGFVGVGKVEARMYCKNRSF